MKKKSFVELSLGGLAVEARPNVHVRQARDSKGDTARRWLTRSKASACNVNSEYQEDAKDGDGEGEE